MVISHQPEFIRAIITNHMFKPKASSVSVSASGPLNTLPLASLIDSAVPLLVPPRFALSIQERSDRRYAHNARAVSNSWDFRIEALPG
jgi:hypothetical protein